MPFERSRSVAALAAVLGVVGCISGDAHTQGPPPLLAQDPPPLLQVFGRDIGLAWANVTVLRSGVGDEGARVVVNGTVLQPWAPEPGTYSGQLPAPLAPGDPVSLEVTSGGLTATSGDLTVTGSGTLPDPPFILAAYTSAAVASDGDIIVTWTSPSDPDYFVAAVGWGCGPGCGAGKDFPATGSSRMLRIPAGALPPGQTVDVAVFAYEDGTLEGDYAPFPEYPGMNIRSESGRIAVVTDANGQPPARLEVRGQDIGASGASVYVTQNGQGIDDAEVAVNGQVIPAVPRAGGWYLADFVAPVWAGDPVSLEVTRGGLRVTGLGTLPDAPFLTSPVNGTGLLPGQDVVVTWTSPTDPDYFEVNAHWPCGPSCGTGTSFTVAGSARTFAIPPEALPTGSIQLSVFAYDDGTLGGDYAPYLPYPGMNIRAESGQVTVSR